MNDSPIFIGVGMEYLWDSNELEIYGSCKVEIYQLREYHGGKRARVMLDSKRFSAAGLRELLLSQEGYDMRNERKP
jgi:hypothetical protein